MRYRFGALCAALVSGSSAFGITFGQIDTFQDGTVMGWQTGPTDPSPPANIANGGPAGAGDRYMLLTSSGGLGVGGKLVVHNQAQWSGNYTAAGVTVIRMNLNNLGNTDLNIRLLFESVGILDQAITTNSFNIAAGSGWVTAVIPIAASDLTPIIGTSANALANTFRFRILHGTGLGFPPAPIAASLGVDNINAVPEPATIAVLSVGTIALIRRRRAR